VKQAGFFADYARSLKDPAAEEIIDLLLFRPLGYLFAKIFIPFPITPNQVSYLAMAAGIGAGIFLSKGTPGSVMAGGILYGLSNILDCSDGMLARIKGNGSPTGRIVDGVVDYITGISVYIGLGIGLSRAVRLGLLHVPLNAWILVAIAAASTVFHAILSDKYRNAYLNRHSTGTAGGQSESEKFTSELSRLDGVKGKLIDRALIRLYLKYVKLQAGKAPSQGRKAPANAPASITPAKVIAWNLIGPSTHVTFFILAAVLYKPLVLFCFVAGVGNVWMIALMVSGAISSQRQARWHKM